MATKLGKKLVQAKEKMVMIRSDFNARIGREGILYNGEIEENQGRKNSKDKVVNGKKVKMLKMVVEHILMAI